MKALTILSDYFQTGRTQGKKVLVIHHEYFFILISMNCTKWDECSFRISKLDKLEKNGEKNLAEKAELKFGEYIILITVLITLNCTYKVS